MNEEQTLEMIENIFNDEIFVVEDSDTEINSFCLASKPAATIKLLVLLNDPAHEKAAAADIELLNKIADFKEYHLTREEVIVLNIANQEMQLNQLIKKFSSPNILCFGVAPGDIGLQIDGRNNQLIRFAGINFVFTSALREISKDEKLKKQFFLQALKPMFSSDNQTQK